MDYADIYFVVASVSTVIVALFFVIIVVYIISILSDVKRLSHIAKKEAEIIAKGVEKGADLLGHELSVEAAGFVKTVFSLLLSRFVKKEEHKGRKSLES